MPDVALENFAVHQLCAFVARHKVPNPFAGPRGRALHRNFSIVGINVHLTYSADCQESDSLCSDGSEDCCRLRLIPLTLRWKKLAASTACRCAPFASESAACIPFSFNYRGQRRKKQSQRHWNMSAWFDKRQAAAHSERQQIFFCLGFVLKNQRQSARWRNAAFKTGGGKTAADSCWIKAGLAATRRLQTDIFWKNGKLSYKLHF